MSFFSVIIPLFNKQDFIEDSLKSVLNQTFKDFEIIIIDDGSTDNSFQLATQFKDPRINLIQQKNQGVSIARNNGINQSKSKYIALLDADDIWHSNHLSELKKQILQFPEAGLYCNNYQVYYSKTLYKPANFNFKYGKECLLVDDFFKVSTTNTIALTSAVGFSKEKFNNIGQFNPYLRTGQDSDLWIRLALKYNVSFNPTITMSYKIFIDNSLSKNEYNEIKYNFVNSYNKEEQLNASLKTYLDIIRYSIAIRSKLGNDLNIYNKLKTEINYNNLNYKQKLLLNLPKPILVFTKKLQQFLIQNKIYLTAYS